MSLSTRKKPISTAKPSTVRNSKPAKTMPRKPKPSESTLHGRRLIANMEKLIVTAKAGGMAAVEKKYTVRRARRGAFPKPGLQAADIVAIRHCLGLSQALFAELLGAALNTVQAWEQGTNSPSGIASRFLAELQRDPDYWKARIVETVR
jgi:putative transcriptional regulator